jgi:hypothetical protein
MVERAAEGRTSRRWRPPRARSLPVVRVIVLRFGVYAAMVALLVLLHPLRPVPMLIVASVLALAVVGTQWTWRLAPKATWDEPGVVWAQLLTLALTVTGLTIVIAGADDAVPRNLESLHSASLFIGAAMAFLGAGLFESIARREGGAWYPVSAVVLVGLGAAYFVGLGRLGTGWWSWVPLAAVLAAPLFVGIASGWLIRRRLQDWQQVDRRDGAALAALGVALVALAGARAIGLVEWWVVWWMVSWLPAIALLLHRPRPAPTVGLLVALTGAVALPLLLMARYHLPAPQLWMLTLLLLVVILVAVDNNTDVVIIVVLAAVVWSGLPRSVPPDEALQPVAGQPAFAAMGDSFVSGEGAQRYIEGTNRRLENECRRAPTAYPVLLARAGVETRRLPSRVVFVACSGAVAEHVWWRPQFAGEPPGGPPSPQLAQLVQLVDDHDVDLEMVVLSVGGNDAGFGVIARTCFLPGPCDELAERWTGQLVDPDGLPARLDRAYAEIAAALPGVRVVVIPYPVPIEPDSCSDSTLSDAEHRFLHDHTVRLNSVVGEAAARADFEFAAEVQWALLDAGQALCGDGDVTGVNWLDLNPVGGSLAQTVNPRNWLHNSLHPNERGHATIAVAIERWLAGERSPDRAAEAVDLARPVSTPTPSELPEVCGQPTPHDVDACERAWMFGHASAVLVGPSAVMLALVLCYWLVAVELIAWWRARSAPGTR